MIFATSSVVPARPKRNEVLFQYNRRVCPLKQLQDGKVSNIVFIILPLKIAPMLALLLRNRMIDTKWYKKLTLKN